MTTDPVNVLLLGVGLGTAVGAVASTMLTLLALQWTHRRARARRPTHRQLLRSTGRMPRIPHAAAPAL